MSFENHEEGKLTTEVHMWLRLGLDIQPPTSFVKRWLTYLLRDFRMTFVEPAIIYCDNHSAIRIATNPVFHERTKHIEIDCHVVRQKIISGHLKLLPVSSSLQLADIFTKALPSTVFQPLCNKLGMLNIHSQLEGGILTASNKITGNTNSNNILKFQHPNY